ncbi:DUF1307 domain-containing protein [Erysipelothrix sp. HDW6C]|uniref:DUF1307 domain-containing protein n=1 Tax=Erysipelothrix sp. HDW6C TaxID=2714930 RepID=UPI00140CA345|nr:DUF1307 domain-containing protein [Erysipelothrix sp. HDW6C]QIK68775.1 DUF1307 domain-containing protein [Erysipelothrix sp. HDW6C]
MMKKLLMALLAVLLLVGCSSKEKDEPKKEEVANKEKENVTKKEEPKEKEVEPEKLEDITVCTKDSPYLVYESGEQTFVSEGDVVTMIRIKAILDTGDKATLDAIMEQADVELEKASALKGVTASIERIDDTKIYDIAEMDLEIADLQELSKAGLLQLDTDQKVAYISLTQSIANIKTMGFTCKTQ